jgi:hypothetical protein
VIRGFFNLLPRERLRITFAILRPENPKSEDSKRGFRHDSPTCWSFEHLDFGHSQSFGFRISDFELRISSCGFANS